MNCEIITPKNKVLFFDLDKTLLDKNYQITDIKVIDSMKKMQNEGWILGLNSDTPLQALKIWSERFGLNGPIIAERGGVVMFNGKSYYDDNLQKVFEKSKFKIIETAKNLPNSFIWEGDQIDLIRRGEKLPEAALSTAILVNNLRLTSTSFHIRKVEFDGRLTNNREIYETTVKKLRCSYPEIPNLMIDENPEYGIVILSSSKINKRAGTKSIMELASWNQIGMVGDSDSDFIGHDIAVQYAVANSTNDYKQKADYLAKSSYSTGVKEICDLLIRKKN